MCGLCSAQATDSNNQVTATVSAILMQSVITWFVGTVAKIRPHISNNENKLCSLMTINKKYKKVVRQPLK